MCVSPLTGLSLSLSLSLLKHHHDHFVHIARPGAHAAVSVDLQPRVDQHARGQPDALRGDHPHALQHSGPYRPRGRAALPLHADSRHRVEGKPRTLFACRPTLMFSIVDCTCMCRL